MAFEIVDRAAAGRIGRLSTRHGVVTTPTLMPVINPNIALLSARKMQESFGTQMVITNSYVIHKHDDLREAALSDGVHALLDWDGPVMSDSGTFQSYVYGDVELDPIDIVRFQADMGVDVATCLDHFVTPDMGEQEATAATQGTIQRTREAAEAMQAWRAETGADASPLLNATVQGGTFPHLRKQCATAYRDIDVGYHTIGGVVPMMEQQRYPELVQTILASQQGLRKDRAVHLFGAGHPLVFPIAVALGCDLFDSSGYAKYAKDGRLMMPDGTLHLEDLEEFPCVCPDCAQYTPKELQQASKQERMRVLASHNLHVSFGEMRRIRTAIRDGVLWELVEQRAACHPMLAAATRMLREADTQEWLENREPVSGRRAIRYTGSLTHTRPIFHRIRTRLMERVEPVAPAVEVQESAWAAAGTRAIELGLHKEPTKTPFGPQLGALDAEQEHAVVTALGPVPVGLDETYPFAQSSMPRLDGLDREHMGWVGETKDRFLEKHTLVPAIPGPPGPEGALDLARMQVVRTADWQFGLGAGKALTDGELKLEASRRTGKLRTVWLDGEHVLSLRAGDGMFTLKPPGAQRLHAALPPPRMRVTVAEDSVPFNRDGKSAFAQFVTHCDPGLRPGDECLLVDQDDQLVAVGRLHLAPDEIPDFQSGMAVRVRDGIAEAVQTASV